MQDFIMKIILFLFVFLGFVYIYKTLKHSGKKSICPYKNHPHYKG